MRKFSKEEVNERLGSVNKMELRNAVNNVINKGKDYIYQCEDMTEDLALCFDRYNNDKMLTLNELNNIYQLLTSVSVNFLNRIITPTCIEKLLEVDDAMSSGAFVGETIELIEGYLKDGLKDKDVKSVIQPILATLGKVVADIEAYNIQVIEIIELLEDKSVLSGLEEDFDVLKMLTSEISSLLDDITGIRSLLDLNFSKYFNYVITEDSDTTEESDGFDILDFERM